jgi:hypothetical protein
MRWVYMQRIGNTGKVGGNERKDRATKVLKEIKRVYGKRGKSRVKGKGSVQLRLWSFPSWKLERLEVLVSTVLPAGSSEVNTVRQGEIFREAC